MKFKLLFLMIAFLTSSSCWAQQWKVYPYAPKGSLISFPADEGRHSSQPVEWWYTSGHLTNKTGKTYSYMLTYFYYPTLGYDGFRILNVTDEATGTFYQDSKPLNYTFLSTSSLNIQASIYRESAESWSNKVDANNKIIPFEYSIKAASSAIGLHLDYVSSKPPLILNDSGYLKQGLDSYTYYYSQTENAVSGTLSLNGVGEEVTGTAWIDRQYGNFDPHLKEKYEWFRVQLSNGMDINMWNIFTSENTVPNNSMYRLLTAYVDDSTQYTTNDLTIERLGYNWMPDSAMCYSNKWRLTSSKNKIDIVISIKNDNTEVQSPFRFFEGATEVLGTVNGKAVTGFGFAELLHSYTPPSLSIANPVGGTFKTSLPISWQLNNRDDGDPVTYDVQFSTNDKATFTTITTGLKDTSYMWENPAVKNGDRLWFKITAHSVDNKLKGTVISSSPSIAMKEQTDSEKVRVFPNPATDNLFIEPAFQMDNPVCKIVDVNGQVVQIFKSNSISDRINVSFLTAGVYFLKIGEQRDQAIKFVKK
jgi:predicted secreted hydrolase